MFISKELVASNDTSMAQLPSIQNVLSNEYRFRVLKCQYTISDQIGPELYHHFFIALVHTLTELPVWITPYAQYYLSRNFGQNVIQCWTSNESDVYTISQFLNFSLIEKREVYNITSIEEVYIDMIKDFLAEKDIKKNGKSLAKQTLIDKRNTLSMFFYLLCKSEDFNMKHLKPRDLLTVESTNFSDQMGRRITMPRVNYHIPVLINNNVTGLQQLYRDMPLSMAERFIKCAEIYDPTLAFAIGLSLYAGLREGEVCSIRQPDSVYGASVIFTLVNGHCTSMQINLEKNYSLRDDGKITGGIKKRRNRPVCAQFLPILWRLYQNHLSFINDVTVDPQKPMFPNQRIDNATHTYRAMTVYGYRHRLDVLLNEHLLPDLRKDPDPDIQLWCQQLLLHTWGAHAFRHWFTVALVLMDYDCPEIMNFRGDSSPQSAMTYLSYKGELIRKYQKSAERIGLMIRSNDENGELK